MIEQDPEIALQKVNEGSRRLINVNTDNIRIEEKNFFSHPNDKKNEFIKIKAKTSQCG